MAIKDSRLVYHLAAVMRDTVFESSHLNNVQTTINLLNGIFQHDSVRRFVNVSSFVVYSNMNLHRGALLDETCEREPDPVGRGDAYCNSKILQEDWVVNKCKQHGLSHVIVRPAIVYGPDHEVFIGWLADQKISVRSGCLCILAVQIYSRFPMLIIVPRQ